jgi:uncharacterized protein YecE (DUF72 family)
MTKRDDRQLDLFAEAAPNSSTPEVGRYPPALLELAAALPKHLRLGTSSWTFPGWAGLVYQRTYPNQRVFTRESLSEYARHPLLTTVGIDRSHYAPLDTTTLREYASMLPAGFRCVMKAWDELTTMVFPDHERYGPRRGQRNPSFLDPVRFREAVAGPVLDAFADHIGPIVLEVAPMRRAPSPKDFEHALEHFLQKAPPELHYAVELRNPELVTPRYLGILRHYAASHVLNFWTLMKPLREQLAVDGILPGPVVVSRLLLPPYTGYEQRKRELSPFDRIVDVQHEMREDVVGLVERCGELGHTLYVIANNKAEGSAPLTLRAIAELVVARQRGAAIHA